MLNTHHRPESELFVGVSECSDKQQKCGNKTKNDESLKVYEILVSVNFEPPFQYTQEFFFAPFKHKVQQ